MLSLEKKPEDFKLWDSWGQRSLEKWRLEACLLPQHCSQQCHRWSRDAVFRGSPASNSSRLQIQTMADTNKNGFDTQK
jgi:hypothetical protein